MHANMRINNLHYIHNVSSKKYGNILLFVYNPRPQIQIFIDPYKIVFIDLYIYIYRPGDRFN